MTVWPRSSHIKHFATADSADRPVMKYDHSAQLPGSWKLEAMADARFSPCTRRNQKGATPHQSTPSLKHTLLLILQHVLHNRSTPVALTKGLRDLGLGVPERRGTLTSRPNADLTIQIAHMASFLCAFHASRGWQSTSRYLPGLTQMGPLQVNTRSQLRHCRRYWSLATV